MIIVCGKHGSPGRKTFDPFAKTVLTVALQPITLVQACPVVPLSLISLDIAGIPVFIGVENQVYYNLNLANWPFLTSCFIPPTMYDSTSVSCGATCIPLDDSQC